MAQRNWDAELAEAEKLKKEARRGKALACDHNDNDPVVELAKFSQYSVPNRGWYPASAVIHPRCGTIFDATPYDPKKVFLIFYEAKSVLHQIKFLTNANANMSPDKLDALNTMLAQLEDIEVNVTPFYTDMIKALQKQENNNKNNKNNRRKTGHIGINAGVYG